MGLRSLTHAAAAVGRRCVALGAGAAVGAREVVAPARRAGVVLGGALVDVCSRASGFRLGSARPSSAPRGRPPALPARGGTRAGPHRGRVRPPGCGSPADRQCTCSSRVCSRICCPGRCWDPGTRRCLQRREEAPSGDFVAGRGVRGPHRRGRGSRKATPPPGGATAQGPPVLPESGRSPSHSGCRELLSR